jgi:ABC-type tungstate transport system permease subunit
MVIAGDKDDANGKKPDAMGADAFRRAKRMEKAKSISKG